MTKFSEHPLEQPTWEIIKTELWRIDMHYGPGSEHYQSYHNRGHTEDVLSAATAIVRLAMERGKIDPRDAQLVRIGAAFHDDEHTKEGGVNETLSAQYAKEIMARKGVFTEEDAEKVGRYIMGTQMLMIDGVLHQAAEQGDYPTMALADADLSNLGRPREFFWKRSTKLFYERFPEEQTIQTQLSFLDDQVKFLENHHYLTPEGAELFSHQDENIAYTKEVREWVRAEADAAK